MKRKIVLVLFVLVLILGAWGLVLQKHNSPQPEIKKVQSNWKTYRNAKYGFEFEYPATVEPSLLPDEGDAISYEVVDIENFITIVNKPLNKDTAEKDYYDMSTEKNINMVKKMMISGKQGFSYDFVTSVNYKIRGLLVPLDGRHYLEIEENSKYPLLGDKQWEHIISTFRFFK